MKYITPSTAFIVASMAFCSCSKTNDPSSDKFVCDIASSDLPANDTAVVFIPNAFSPNGDGLNDVYRPALKYVQSVEWGVYDQNNHQLFTTTDLLATWAPSGNFNGGVRWYHYKITAVSNQGNKFSQCGAFCAFSCIPDGFKDAGSLVFGDQYDPAAPKGYLNSVSQELNVTFVPCK